jgi:queuine/archaeosine tRNA-ribosyltransferase
MPVDGIMTSADDYQEHGDPAIMQDYSGFHAVDSGGYRLLSQRRKLDCDSILAAQRDSGGDLFVSLDYPLSRVTGRKTAKLRIRKSAENARTWVVSFGASKVMPVIHGHSQEQLRFAKRQTLRWLDGYFDQVNYLGLGSIARLSQYEPRQMVKLIKSARRLFPDKHLHVFGVGNSSAVICAKLGDPDSLSMAVITSRTVSRPSITARKLFARCDCPSCGRGQTEIAKWTRQGFLLRATHNAWMARKLVHEGRVHPRWAKYLPKPN